MHLLFVLQMGIMCECIFLISLTLLPVQQWNEGSKLQTPEFRLQTLYSKHNYCHDEYLSLVLSLLHFYTHIQHSTSSWLSLSSVSPVSIRKIKLKLQLEFVPTRFLQSVEFSLSLYTLNSSHSHSCKEQEEKEEEGKVYTRPSLKMTYNIRHTKYI